MSFQTRKAWEPISSHLQNTNKDIFDEIREAFWPSIDGNATETFKAQKGK